MKKGLLRVLAALAGAALLAGAVSCSDVQGEGGTQDENGTATGSISGKVTFSNVAASANAGILVTLDKTDGLRTVAVTQSVAARSVVSNARTVAGNTVTASDGSYTFANLEPGTYTVYAASSYSSEKAVCTNVVVRAAETTVAESLRLTATGSIAGTITTDGNTSGNTGFLVFVAGTSYMAMTDEAGAYTISGVPAGSGYQVVATKNGVIRNVNTSVTVSANDTKSLTAISFTSAELQAGLKGEKGDIGATGADGKDGISIVWKGPFASADEIEDPETNWAYFNTTDGCSYIYDGTEWTLLAQSGANGADGKNAKDEDNMTPYYTAGVAVTNPTVTAKWDFTGFTKDDIPSGTEPAAVAEKVDGKKTGIGAAIDLTDASVESNTDRLAITVKSSSSLSNLEAGQKFTLTVDDTTNLVMRAKGYGQAAPNRYLALADQTGRFLVAKGAMHDGKTTDFVVPGLPAGVYTVYASGIVFYAIDCGVAAYDLPAIPAPVTSLDFVTKDGMSISKYTGEAIMDGLTVQARNGVTGENVTNDAVWESSAPDVASVSYGVITLRSAGKAVISARIDNVIKPLYVTVTPCTKTIVTLIDSAKLPAESETIDLDNPSENVIAALTPTIAGSDILTASTATLSRGEGLKEPAPGKDLTLGKAGDSVTNANNYDYGLNWKDGGSAKDTEYASITCTVTPGTLTGGKKLALTRIQMQSFPGAGNGHISVTPTIGETVGNTIAATKAWTIDAADQYCIIDGETQITLSFKKLKEKDGGSFGVQDLQLIFEEVVPLSLTSLSVPQVGNTVAGKSVSATIIGENFDEKMDFSRFTATCSAMPSIVSGTTFTWVSDTVLTATLTIPSAAGDYDITVAYGENSVKGTLKVQDFSAYSVGDVLLSDGTIVPYNADNLTFTDEQKAKAVGVLYGFDEYGTPSGWLGLYNSSGGTNSGYKVWAQSGTKGYNTMLTDIICTPSEKYYSGSADKAAFTGDTDGSDNWAYICSVDPEGTADAATNYPAFNYVNTYASTFGLTGGYATGWYMPSIAELCYIYRSKDVLNSVLDALDGIQLYSGYYWSSSQYADSTNNAWGLSFANGYLNDYYKDYDGYVCCVRAFN
ncbi:MAG: DUF1566 domain-containing protein [Treponema sp.]|nr:DUF1566 domain-containing protein [Treponema sp.]